MLERINANIADSGVGDVFVGNVHRFCSKFLFANGLVAAESSVIDEEDAVSILARYTGEDEYFVLGDFRRRREYSLIFHLESMMHQIASGASEGAAFAHRLHQRRRRESDAKHLQRVRKGVRRGGDGRHI